MVGLRRRFAWLLLVCSFPAAAQAQIVVAPDEGADPIVTVVYSDGRASSFLAYPSGFKGGVRLALGDVNADGILDIITGAGRGGAPLVKVFSGADFSELASFFAYEPTFRGGIFVAAGDVDGDGHADIITGTGPGGSPFVRVLSGADLSQVVNFFAYDPAFNGGVSVAAGDVNGDGLADIITAPGPGAGAQVKVMSGADLSVLASFFAYDPAFTGGVSLASGDINDDGVVDIITGAGPGGGPYIKVLNGAAGFSELASFYAYDGTFTDSVSVAAVDFDDDGQPEIVTGPGPGGSSLIRILSLQAPDPRSLSLTEIASLFPFDPTFTGGVFVGSVAGGGGGLRFTSPNAATFTVGSAGTFTITTAGGSGTPTLTATGTLPAGVTFTDNGDGTATLAGTPDAGTGGTYPLTFTATPAVGTPVTQNFTLTVNQAPAITSAASTTFAVGALGSFTVTTTGFPTPTLAQGGALPAGVTFVDNLNGTGTLSGTPDPGTGGTYAITFTAANGVASPVVQSFTLTVTQLPVLTIADVSQAETGGPTTFVFTVSLSAPAPPGGVTFDIATADGTATAASGDYVAQALTGQTIPAGSSTYVFTVTVNGDATAEANETFQVAVSNVTGAPVGDGTAVGTIVNDDDPAPVITSANTATFVIGIAGTFTVTATGFPTPSLTRGGVALPAGVTFVDNGNGTGTLSGTPDPGTGGTYALTFTAANGVPPDAVQNFTLTVVNPNPVITAGGTLNYTEGNPATAIDTTITVTDADSANLTGATVQITGNYVNGQDLLGFTPAFGIVGSFVPATGTLTLSGSSSVLNYQTALRTVTYFNNSATPSILPRTVTWIVSDGVHSSNQAFSTITVAAVNSAPVGGIDAWTTFGNTELVVDQAGPSTPFVADTTTSTFGVLDNDADPENDPRVVTGIFGCGDTSAPFVCTTTAGGSVTMESNGRFTYRPEAGDTGPDSFQYIVTDVPATGTAASATVTVNLTLQERIWYVDGSVAGPGTGASHDPFNALPATIGDADDYIFVHDSTLGGSITLQSGQKLYGEGFGLSIAQALNGNPSPVVLVQAGTNPIINATTGNAVGILANTANGSLTNVEIRGLTLSTTAATSNAIDVTSADAANVGVTISGVTITGATAEGIDVNQGSTGAATIAISNVTVTAAGNGIDLNETAGALTITAFSDLVISGATGGTGIVVNGATFDATPGGAYQQVAGGTTVVGDALDAVGAGIVMTNVSGDLAFTDLDIVTDNGFGLRLTGTGPVNVGAGTGTRVTVAPLVADFLADGGPVVDITNATVGLPLVSASSANSLTTAISLVNVGGGTSSAVFSADSGIILNTTGVSFNVSGGDATITYGGDILHVSTAAMVSVSGHTAGTITFSGTLSATNGTGLQFDNADSTSSYHFTGTTSLGGGDAGIDIINGSAGTFTFGANTSITDPSGTAFFLANSNATVTYSGSISDNSGFAVDIDNHDAGTVTFQTGSITSTGTGIRVANSNGGTINFNSPTIALTTGANKAVTLDTANTGGTINFAPAAGGNGLDIVTTSGTGFSALGGGTISVSGAGSSINAGTGMAIELVGVATAGVNFASTTSGGGVRNVKLTSVTGAGPVALGTGSLTGATGAAFLVGDGAGTASTGGTAAITYGGTITTTGTARAVDIQDRSAGAGNITLSGTITHSSGNANVIFLDGNAAGTIAFTAAGSVLNGGTSTAVSLTNNTGAIINFTGGGLNIDATGATGSGFVATGGGTVNVTGASNTIDTTTSAALNVASTTIGGSGLTFQSISANGAQRGIILNTTGAGAFTVTGTGTTDGSGGTIQNSTGRGAEIISANNITLTNMNFTGNGTAQTVPGSDTNCGGNLRAGNNLSCVANIHLQTVSNVTLTNLNVTNSGQQGINGNGVSNFSLADSNVTGNGNEVFENGLVFQNLTGTCSITNSMIKNNAAYQINVTNIANSSTLTLGITGTRTNAVYPTIDTSTTEIGKDVQTNTFTDQSLLLDSVGTATNVNMTLNVTGVVFKNSLPGNSMLLNPIAASGTFGGTTTNTSFHNTAGGVIIQAQNGMSGTYNVTNSEFNRVNLQSILYGAANPYSGALQGTVSGNHIGEDTTGSAGVGCEPNPGNCNGIQVNFIGGTGSVSTRIQSNSIQQVSGNAILITANGTGSPAVNANIVNNTIQNPAGLIARGIATNMGTTTGANVQGCLGITGNTVNGTYEDPGVGVQLRIVTNVRFLSVHRLPGYAGSATSVGDPTTGQTAAFLNTNNTVGGHVFTQLGGSGTYPGGAACITP